MKLRSIEAICAAALAFIAMWAQASPCNTPVTISSPGFTIPTYLWTDIGTNSISTTRTGQCTKTGINAATYTVAAGGGLNFLGSNRAAFSGSYVNYFVSTLSNCGNTWNAANPISFSFTGAGSFATDVTYYGCVLPGQIVRAGTYVDTVTMTASVGGTGTFPVSINVAAKCTISFAAPGGVSFAYTAFGGVVLANASYSVTCNPQLPYDMSLDATSGVVSGLQYSLGLNTTPNSGGSSPLGSAGTGLAQTFYVNGTMPANQAGTCSSSSCTGSNTHTLTITY